MEKIMHGLLWAPKWLGLASRALRLVSSGPTGVEGRLPTLSAPASGGAGAVAITDPYILYQHYISLGILHKDMAQVRVMKEFQKLYFRLRDYRPPQELGVRLSLVIRKLELQRVQEARQPLATLFGLRLLQVWRDPSAERRGLIRALTDEEELHNLAAPQGLLLNGEVGCGKSMLMDIFATTLPHDSKMRWHYNNFILWVFSELHQIQRERLVTASAALSMESEFILYEVAQKMIARSTVLMLDEFMLPDIAAATIVRTLLTYYFKLGGVLVATSNRLPEDLYSHEFHKRNFRTFVGVLHSRCQAVDMMLTIDYRVQPSGAVRLHLVVESAATQEEWLGLIAAVVGQDRGLPATLQVYGRAFEVPRAFCHNTVCLIDFDHLCQGLHAASDYITLASTYHTVFVDHVPAMSLKMKNEARRFITFLDAVYEAKCQLYIRSEVEADELFFTKEEKEEEEEGDAEEAARMMMALQNPYRPNVLEYGGSNAEYLEQPPAPPTPTMTVFTGEDEKFAYKRAVSRIHEMVRSPRWRHSQWVPIDALMRPWEKTTAPRAAPRLRPAAPPPPLSERPQIDVQHIWAMGHWTRLNGRRVKDAITKRWVRSSMKPKD